MAVLKIFPFALVLFVLLQQCSASPWWPSPFSKNDDTATREVENVSSDGSFSTQPALLLAGTNQNVGPYSTNNPVVVPGVVDAAGYLPQQARFELNLVHPQPQPVLSAVGQFANPAPTWRQNDVYNSAPSAVIVPVSGLQVTDTNKDPVNGLNSLNNGLTNSWPMHNNYGMDIGRQQQGFGGNFLTNNNPQIGIPSSNYPVASDLSGAVLLQTPFEFSSILNNNLPFVSYKQNLDLFNEIRNKATEILNDQKQMLNGIIGDVESKLLGKEMLLNAVSSLSDTISGTKQNAHCLASQVKGKLDEVLKGKNENVNDFVKELENTCGTVDEWEIKNLFDRVKQEAKDVGHCINDMKTKFGADAKDILSEMENTLYEIVRGVKEEPTDVIINQMISKYGDRIVKYQPYITHMIDNIKDDVQGKMGNIKDSIDNMREKFADLISDATGKSNQFLIRTKDYLDDYVYLIRDNKNYKDFQVFIDHLEAEFGDMVNDKKDYLKTVSMKLKDKMDDINEKVSEMMKKYSDLAGLSVERAKQFKTDLTNKLIEDLKNGRIDFDAAFDEMKKEYGNIMDGKEKYLKGLFVKMEQDAKGRLGDIKHVVEDLESQVSSIFNNKYNLAKGLMKSFIENFLSAIKANEGFMQKYLKDMKEKMGGLLAGENEIFKNIIDIVHNKMDSIGSPEKILEQFGNIKQKVFSLIKDKDAIIKKGIDSLQARAGEMLNARMYMVNQMFAKINDFLTKLPRGRDIDMIINIAKNYVLNCINFLGSTTDSVRQIFNAYVNIQNPRQSPIVIMVELKIKELLKSYRPMVNMVSDFVKDQVNAIANAGKITISSSVDGLNKNIGTLIDKEKQMASAIINNVREKLRYVQNLANDENLKKFVNNLKLQIENTLAQSGEKLINLTLPIANVMIGGGDAQISGSINDLSFKTNRLGNEVENFLLRMTS